MVDLDWERRAETLSPGSQACALGTREYKMAQRVGIARFLGSVARRSFSSRAARPEHLRAYLDVWMGSTAPSPNGHISISSDGKPLALTVTGRQYLVPTLRLPVDTPSSELQEGVEASSSLATSFGKAPIVIDLTDWSAAARLKRSTDPLETASKLSACISAFRQRGLHPVGVSNAFTPELQAAALELGLPCFMSQLASHTTAPPPPMDRSRPSKVSETAGAARVEAPREGEKAEAQGDRVGKRDKRSTSQASSEPNTPDVATPPPHIVQGSVRTGQQVIASEGRSLVVMGNVHSGAEVAADGDIHVYGKLSGRALAGLSGNSRARVFAAKFNAELVAIADTFVTGDQPSDLKNLVVNSTTIVSLEEGKHELTFQSI